MLAGDLIKHALSRLDPLATPDLVSAPISPSDFDQGGTDPGNIVEFLAFDIAFDVEPATGLFLSAETEDD
jgi:hypothetical protein